MKTQEQIAARIKELRTELEGKEDSRKGHAKATGANRSTLGIKRKNELEGEIAGLEWILNSSTRI